MSRYAILLGGTVVPSARLKAQMAGRRVIAADSGMAHAASLGVSPELWVGDFDSSGPALEQSHPDVPRMVYPVAKSATDGEIAVNEAITRGARDLMLIGAFGGQFDHAMAHATQLLGLSERGVTCFATSGNEEAWPLLNSLTLWQIPRHTRISIIGLTPMKALSIIGVRWPLNRRDVDLGSTLTLSNEATGDVAMTLEQGRAVVLVYPQGEKLMAYRIERLGQKGDGLAGEGQGVVAIAKTLPGELVEAADGRLQKVLEASPERIKPFCEYFDRCGGCKFQHWKLEPYQAWKRGLLVEALLAKGLSVDVSPLVDAHGRGRRRVSLHVREIDGTWCAGFMEQRSHVLIAINHCPVCDPALQDAPNLAAAFGPSLGVCDVAVTAARNGLDVSIKAERKVVLRRLEPLNEIMRKYGILRLSINGETFAALAQPVVRMGGADVVLPTTSFLQATAEGEVVLSDLVTQALKSSRHVADLFCGVGPFAFRLAASSRVYAADSDKAAIANVRDALRNTQGLKPLDAQARDLFREPLTPLELKPFDGVVLDPPRAGAEAQCRTLAKSAVKKVVMVACDVGSFSRDAALLVQGGYKLKSVTPVDQFKWTSHLEMVGVFQR